MSKRVVQHCGSRNPLRGSRLFVSSSRLPAASPLFVRELDQALVRSDIETRSSSASVAMTVQLVIPPLAMSVSCKPDYRNDAATEKGNPEGSDSCSLEVA
jgi:hypothetical protein